MKSPSLVFFYFETSDHCAVVIKFTSELEGYHRIRKETVEIVAKNYKGLKVPVDSIIVENGKKYVNVVGMDDKVERVRIKEVGRYEGVAVIYEDRFTVVDETGESKSIKTVRLYDEIIRVKAEEQ